MPHFPRPGWTPVEPFPFANARRTFAGPTSSKGLLMLDYYRRPDGGMAAVASFGPLSEGAPGLVHGGMILTVLDEALGAAAWLAGHPVLTVRLETEFRAGVPVRAQLHVETRILAVRRRMVFVEGSLLGVDGKFYAGAKGQFLEVNEETQRRIFGRTYGRP